MKYQQEEDEAKPFLGHDFETNLFTDRYNVPNYLGVYNFHSKYIKNKFGSASGTDAFRKLKENVDEYNIKEGKNIQWLAKPSLSFVMNSIRVHETIPASEDL